MHPASPLPLLLLALAAIALLVTLVTWRKLNAFLALLLAAMATGLGAGMPALGTLKAFQDGVGATLGGIAAVIALGAMLGKLLAESGGAQVAAERFSAFFGPSRALVCVVALAVVIGVVTWFTVGLLLLLPIVVALTHETKRPFLLLALPLVAFLSVMHGLTPPHPGPVAAVDALGARSGLVLVWGLAVGIPAAWLGGVVLARWLAPRLPVATPALRATDASGGGRPGLGATLGVIALPIGLMLAASAAEMVLPAGSAVRGALSFAGHPVVALTLAVLTALPVLGGPAKFSRPQVLAFTEQSVAGIGMTLLVVGGGGGFARVLREAGVAQALGQVAADWSLPPLVFGWLVAAFIRVATGSATVAITTAAGLLAPMLATHPEINRELLVVALGFGSLFLSHLNDGGFWIVKDCLGLTVGQTLRTWSLTETVIGLAGLGGTLVLAALL